MDLQAQYRSIRQEIDEALAETLSRCDFILGSGVRQFEQRFASFCEVEHCLGVGSGTEALHLACRALNIGPGDEVILPSFTFVATALGVTLAGGTPVLVDVNPRNALIDPGKIEQAITERTRAIIVVHIFGQCCDMDPILEIARRRGLALIEDAAQAHGASYKGRKAGSMGQVGCFSFYPGKNLGCYGDGGAVTTGDPELYRAIQSLRHLGSVKKYYHERIGLNSRLDTLQARILDVKLNHLPDWNRRRREIAGQYSAALSGSEFEVPSNEEYGEHVYHLYPILCDRRDDRLARLQEAGIGAGIHYPLAVHQLEAYEHLGYRTGDFPHAESFASRCLSLPLYPEMREDQVEYVLENLLES